jgi:hypothetical protein
MRKAHPAFPIFWLAQDRKWEENCASMAAPADQVFSTMTLEELPPDVLALTDEHVPIPSSVNFFEEQRTMGSVLNAWLLGGGLVLAGGLTALMGIYFLAHPTGNVADHSSLDFKVLAVGGVLIFGGVIVLRSIPKKLSMARAQQSGRVTRYGIFLRPGQMITRNDFGVTIIPRAAFKGLKEKSVQYENKGEIKSFNLPSSVVGKTVEDLLKAIRDWEAVPT